jgi:polygalacturonase
MSYDPYSRILALRAAAATSALASTAGAANVGADDGASGSKFSTVQGFVSSALAPGGAALVGYAPAQSSTISRSVQAKLRDHVNVKDFGAVGDGVTDDTAACRPPSPMSPSGAGN